MYLKVFRDEGLAHLSYLVGDGTQAAVIDPRYDIEAYLETARAQGLNITHIFETHRNEDYVIGSCELAVATGASIHHGSGLNFGYGEPVSEGDSFCLGKLQLRVLETPGHTPESISLVLADLNFADDPIGVFTGDTLFVGEVGRVDLWDIGAEKAAAKLYDSLFEKLLPLGDQVLLYPAHGAGSVCGAKLADREFSTLGAERRNNPRLQLGREEFIRLKAGEVHPQPPYFKRMERLNQEGPKLSAMCWPHAQNAETFAKQSDRQLVDLRSPEAYAGASLPGSLSLPMAQLSGFAGWLLDAEREIALIGDSPEQIEAAVHQLRRLGYERVSAFLKGGLQTWEVSGHAFETLPTVHVEELRNRLEQGEILLLDVRSQAEHEAEWIDGSQWIYVGELPQRLADIPHSQPIVTFCGSGQRAVIAASVLKAAGFEQVEVCLGSLQAWKQRKYPLRQRS